ncbi:hypothetical protein J2Z21_002716 [Streptomyces griseochromogenes]|uniref:MmyB-like transcription regulator ligand binding domain-containing protein n=1 Tax=Streptomyces griseochromogenes TaxID=68214 RepID=A0A1B1AY49_9ACTN|nr:hypothetical protein [Streptomyces griseochromogenes]ANP51461.1 hypothetical protein AVL59_19265 [Streptomyces griseochromogenes]MBP2049780.1 hypothetical protein [Streptomyces griseochromogenes]
MRPRTGEDKRLWHREVGEMCLHHEAFTATGAPGRQLSACSAGPGTSAPTHWSCRAPWPSKHLPTVRP